jgi:alpha-galactosidase
MIGKKVFSAILLIFISLKMTFAFDSYAKWTKTELTLNNGIAERTILLPSPFGNYITREYKPVNGDFRYFSDNSPDFQFELNDKIYSGKSIWNLISIIAIKDPEQGNGAAVCLQSEDKKLELTISYLLYPGSPAIRKGLIIKNLTNETVKLESVDIEKIQVAEYFPVTYSWIYHDYGRRCTIGPYNGGNQDALIIIHNMNWEQGIVIGNEATGVIKLTSVFWEAPEICVGFTHKNSQYPFRKWIEKGDAFETPQVFTMVYNNQKKPDEILNTSLPDFIRLNMGIRLSTLKDKPTFVYNTWEPFDTEINEKLIMELAKADADGGMKEFVIDDGWQDNYGDWNINQMKFPNGLYSGEILEIKVI